MKTKESKKKRIQSTRLPFSIRLRNFSPDAGNFQLEVLDSPYGRMRNPETVPFNTELPPYLQKLANFGGDEGITPDQLITMGQMLGDMLFPTDTRRLFFNMWTEHYDPTNNQGIRILIEADDEELGVLPWEYAYIHEYKYMRQLHIADASKKKSTPIPLNDEWGFLGLDKFISIVRHEPYIGRPLEKPMQRHKSLFVVLSNAEPNDLTKISTTAEIANIQHEIHFKNLTGAAVPRTDVSSIEEVTETLVLRDLSPEKLEKFLNENPADLPIGDIANYFKNHYKDKSPKELIDFLLAKHEQRKNSFQVFHYSGHAGYLYSSEINDNDQLKWIVEQNARVEAKLTKEDEAWERRFRRLLQRALHKEHQISTKEKNTRLPVIGTDWGFGNLNGTADKHSEYTNQGGLSRITTNIYNLEDHREGTIVLEKAETTHTWQDKALTELLYAVKSEVANKERAKEVGVKPASPFTEFLAFLLNPGTYNDGKDKPTILQKDAISFVKALYKLTKYDDPVTLDKVIKHKLPKVLTEENCNILWNKRILPDITWKDKGFENMTPELRDAALRSRAGTHHIFLATKLAELLKESKLQLVVLNGCQTSQSNTRSFESTGVATTLIQAGIPAVIGMQLAIDDISAAHFSRAFYRALSSGLPLEEAVNEGRRSVKESESSHEWGVPTLFVRSLDIAGTVPVDSDS